MSLSVSQQVSTLHITRIGGKSTLSLGWDTSAPARPEKSHVKIGAPPGGKPSVEPQPIGHPAQPKAHVKVSNPPGGKSSITFG